MWPDRVSNSGPLAHDRLPTRPAKSGCNEGITSINSLTTQKQTIKFSFANFSKNVKSRLYDIENSKTSGQTV